MERLGVFLDGHAADRVAACAGPDRGTLVDKALTGMYRAELDGQRPEPCDVLELFERAVEPTIAAEKAGVTFTSEEALASVRDVGRRCVQLYIQQLKPYLGRVHAVQREASIRLAPDCRWTIQGIMDLEAEQSTRRLHHKRRGARPRGRRRQRDPRRAGRAGQGRTRLRARSSGTPPTTSPSR